MPDKYSCPQWSFGKSRDWFIFYAKHLSHYTSPHLEVNGIWYNSITFFFFLWEQTQKSLLYTEEYRQLKPEVFVANVPTFVIPDNVLITGQLRNIRVNFNTVAIWMTVG